jgi:hypothetical protein
VSTRNLAENAREKETPISSPKSSLAVETLRNFALSYQIELVYEGEDLNDSVTLRKPSEKNLNKACKVLINELRLYPTEVIERTNLRRIVLCEGLKSKDKLIGGLCLAKKGTIYISIEEPNKHTRLTFHHELFHSIDYIDDAYGWHDPNWVALNHDGFEYCEATDKDKKAANSANRPGFISDYAMRQAREDKAEIYANLILHYNSLIERAKADEILQKKCKFIMDLLKQFSPQFNELFWINRSQNSEYLPDKIEDPIIVTLEIWGERVYSRPIWFMKRLEPLCSRPIAFYSEEKAIDCLTKLGVIDFHELRNLHIGPRYKVKAKLSRKILRNFFPF